GRPCGRGDRHGVLPYGQSRRRGDGHEQHRERDGPVRYRAAHQSASPWSSPGPRSWPSSSHWPRRGTRGGKGGSGESSASSSSAGPPRPGCWAGPAGAVPPDLEPPGRQARAWPGDRPRRPLGGAAGPRLALGGARAGGVTRVVTAPTRTAARRLAALVGAARIGATRMGTARTAIRGPATPMRARGVRDARVTHVVVTPTRTAARRLAALVGAA